MLLVKSYGQQKTDTDYLAIRLVYCPNFKPKQAGDELGQAQYKIG